MKRFREFIARLILIVVLTGLAMAAARVMTNSLPTWVTLLILAAVLVWLALPPKDKYFLFIVQDGDGKDYLVIARDKDGVPIQRVLGVVADCRIRDVTSINKAQYKAFKKRAEINKSEYFILD